MLVFGGYTLVERAPWVSPEERAALEAARLAEEEEDAQTKSKKGGKKGAKKASLEENKDEDKGDGDGDAADEDAAAAAPKEYQGKYLSDVWVFSAQDNAWRQPGIHGEGPPASAYHAMLDIPLTPPGSHGYDMGDAGGSGRVKGRGGGCTSSSIFEAGGR